MPLNSSYGLKSCLKNISDYLCSNNFKIMEHLEQKTIYGTKIVPINTKMFQKTTMEQKMEHAVKTIHRG